MGFRKSLIILLSMPGETSYQYQALEAGTSDGSIKVWKKLKRLFNCSIDYLLEQEADKEEKPDGNRASEGTYKI